MKTTPSSLGRNLASRVFTASEKVTIMTTNSQACHFCGTYVGSFSTMKPWNVVPIKTAAEAKPAIHESDESQPAQ